MRTPKQPPSSGKPLLCRLSYEGASQCQEVSRPVIIWSELDGLRHVHLVPMNSISYEHVGIGLGTIWEQRLQVGSGLEWVLSPV